MLQPLLFSSSGLLRIHGTLPLPVSVPHRHPASSDGSSAPVVSQAFFDSRAGTFPQPRVHAPMMLSSPHILPEVPGRYDKSDHLEGWLALRSSPEGGGPLPAEIHIQIVI